MLSVEQQNTIENSLWIVHSALEKQGLKLSPQTEDLRQSAILYMCQVIQRFDPSRNIKWETFAYKNVYLYIKRIHKADIKKQSHFVEDDLYDIVEPANLLLEEPELIDENKILINKIKAICTEQESQIIELKLQGYKGTEIGKIIHCSTSKVNKCMQQIKEKAREIEYER